MALPILLQIKNQVDKTLFNTDFKTYFQPLVSTFNPKKTDYNLTAKVINKVMERNDVVSITLKPTKKWKGFVPGQYIALTVKINAVFINAIFRFLLH